MDPSTTSTHAEPESPQVINTYTGTVWTTTIMAGFHNWPDAPESVRHLRDRHRHQFHIRVELGVNHAEREVEFQLLQSNLVGFLMQTFEGTEAGTEYADLGTEFGDRSCESIAQAIMGFLIDFYPSSDPYEVTVSEDGESGATLRVDQR